jgi:hypothetical protein
LADAAVPGGPVRYGWRLSGRDTSCVEPGGPDSTEVAVTRVNPHATGLVFAVFLGLWHTLWALLVLTGMAQPLLDFVFHMHMITPPYHVGPFDAGTAAGLVLLTTAIGYVLGAVIGSIWNRFGPARAAA